MKAISPKFQVCFIELGSQNMRSFAIISNIPARKSGFWRRVENSPIITAERSLKLLIGANDLFTPKDGLLIDMYGNTMKTSIAP